MSLYLFPTNVSRVFPETDMEVVQRDAHGFPTAVCVTARNPSDRAIALALLKESPASFVLFEGVRYLPDGTLHPCNPALPASITELRRAFGVETVEFTWPGPRPRVHIFTYSQQEWEQAKSAVRHLLDLKLLSPRSYIEGELNGEARGLSAQNLDAKPHSAGLVAMFREAAYCVQDDLYEKEGYHENYDDDEGGQYEEMEAFAEDFTEVEDSAEEIEERWFEEEVLEEIVSAAKPYRRIIAWLRQALVYLSHGR